MAANEEKLKRLLMKVEEESEKAGLKLNIQNMKIMTSCPITSWQRFGGESDRLFSWAPKSICIVTLASKFRDTCSLEENVGQN